MQEKLLKIKTAVEQLKKQYPDYQVYITVSKSLNDGIIKFLQGDDYSIRLNSMFSAEYRVSPFMDGGIDFIVWLFDYSQILGLWNSAQDNQYKLSHLFKALVINYEEDAKEEENWGSNE